MSLVINSNIASLDAQRNLSKTQASLATSLQRLSSGLRINSAADDSAGLAISTKMNAQVRSMNQAVRNANDGISLVQTADGALNEVTNILTRMRELTTQSASGTLQASDRQDIGNEFSQLQDEITRIANSTTFNGQKLLTGTGGDTSDSKFIIQVGAGTTSGTDTITLDTSTAAGKGATAADLGVDATTAGLKVDSVADANAATTAIDTAIDTVNNLRSNLGAYQNRLTSTINNLQVGVENTSAAQSRIQDVDVASETANMTRANILSQAGVSILAQANQAPQAALKLLQ
jgi:flagellin